MGAPSRKIVVVVGVGVFFYHETPNFNHNFHLYLIFNLDFRIILILLLTIYLYNAYAAELSFTFFCRGSIILLIKKNSFIMYLDVGFGQPLEEEVCLQCRPSTRWWICRCDKNLMDMLHRTRK